MTTETTAIEPRSGLIVQTQAVFGEKHIADKTKELAARLRSVHLGIDSATYFTPKDASGIHVLVVDGDWPAKNKINLMEAGFRRIYEIAELDRLAADLQQLLQNQGPLADDSPEGYTH